MASLDMRRDHFHKDSICSTEDQLIAKETQTIGGLLLHIEMRPDVEDSEDAPMAPVVDILNSDEPMGLSDRQIVELLESDESSSADESESSSDGED
jgi:hypothetical protein